MYTTKYITQGGGGMQEKPTGGGVITLTGNRSAVIDGCDGVLDYDSEKVVLRAGRLTVRIGGRDHEPDV